MAHRDADLELGTGPRYRQPEETGRAAMRDRAPGYRAHHRSDPPRRFPGPGVEVVL